MQSIAWTLTISVLIGVRAGVALADTAATPEQLRFFESSIRPLLVEKCQGCHGPEKQWGTLRLDSRAAMLGGGETGPVVVPGKPDESLLIKAVRRTDDTLQMPPKESLSLRQIADLTRWVEMGAPFPLTTDVAGSRSRDPNHWSFQTPRQPHIPLTNDSLWASGPWDQFVLAKLEQLKFVPVEKASPRTLLNAPRLI